MRYSRIMSDIKKKLDGLAAQLGMVSAKDLLSGERASAPNPEKPAAPSSASGEEAHGKTGGVLSPGMAGQLAARLGLEGGHAQQEHAGGDSDGPPEIEAVIPGQVVGDDGYGFFLYRRSFPLDHLVGAVPVGAGLACDGAQIALSACDTRLRVFDPLKTCYVDTETTGLAGGAGTVAFLVGLGYFRGDAFILEQCFMRDYDDEGAMLEYLAERFGEFDCVVSYNGKSFDLPLLRARCVQHRLPAPFKEAAHYDLVHAVRRVWKQRLSDCSLNNIERLVLNFHREGDVPGFLIPGIWLDYLVYRDARPLEGVFYHHAMDIVSLAALAGHLSQRLATTDGPAFHHAEDQLSLIRLYYKNKEYASVMEHTRAFLGVSQVTDDLRRECLHLLGKAAKKINRFDDMYETWKQLHEEYPEDCEGAAELAKFIEHQLRNPRGAAEICRETLQAIEASKGLPGLSGDFRVSALRGRLKRLEGKIDRRFKPKHGEEDGLIVD